LDHWMAERSAPGRRASGWRLALPPVAPFQLASLEPVRVAAALLLLLLGLWLARWDHPSRGRSEQQGDGRAVAAAAPLTGVESSAIQPRRGEIAKPRATPWESSRRRSLALKGRNSSIPPLQGSTDRPPYGPRALPWALLSRPFGAEGARLRHHGSQSQDLARGDLAYVNGYAVAGTLLRPAISRDERDTIERSVRGT